jgi:sulfopyruvate decarboxylase TPP-binding subunit
LSAEKPTPGETLFRSIAAAKPKLVTGVPDGMLADVIMRCEASPDFDYIPCAREEECIGVASGAALTGERCVVMMQNAGLLNSLGALSTMAIRYQLPFVILVTNRGVLADPNSYDIEKYMAFEASVKTLTPVFSYPMAALPDDLVPAAFKWSEAARRPAIIALEKSL